MRGLDGPVGRPLAGDAKGHGSKAPDRSCTFRDLFLGHLYKYDMVGSLVSSGGLAPANLGSIPAEAFEFNHVITLSKLIT